VTSARFTKWNGRGRQGDGDEPATRETQQNRVLVSAKREAVSPNDVIVYEKESCDNGRGLWLRNDKLKHAGSESGC
jgi:hypothetical protein